MGLSLGGCFTDLTVPSCRTPGDCPADYTACLHSLCFFRNTGCEEAGPVSGDGCCSGWEADRSPDGDCRTFDLALEMSEFSQPAVRTSDGTLFFHGRSSRDGRVHLLQVTSRGDPVWDLPLGTAEILLPPVLRDDDTVLSPVPKGIQIVDVARRQAIDLIPSPAPPAGPLCATDDALAWVDRDGSIHLFHPGSGRRVVLPGEGDGLPPVHSRQADAFLVARSDGSLRGLSPEATSAADAITATLDLGTRIAAPPVIAGERALVVTESGTLIAVSLAKTPWHRAWETNLGGPSPVAPLVDSRGRILVIREDGTLFVVREVRGQGVVAGSVALPEAGASPALLITGAGRIVHFRDGRLRSLLVREEGGGLVFSEGFSYAVDGRQVVPVLVDRRIVLALDTGHVLGLVSPEGPDPGPWSRPLGDEANRMSGP
ncbi:hypothetical protein KBD49_13920 [Myxococcota bacterium]|nr:hypothetical protein [Myxococcota bacterium]